MNSANSLKFHIGDEVYLVEDSYNCCNWADGSPKVYKAILVKHGAIQSIISINGAEQRANTSKLLTKSQLPQELSNLVEEYLAQINRAKNNYIKIYQEQLAKLEGNDSNTPNQ